MNFRTDLAIELAQQLQDTVSQDYQTVQKEEDGAVVFHTKILTPAGERQFGKPAGDYITVEVVPFSDSVTDSAREAEVIARQIKSLLPGQDGLVLVVGLGNLSITPDALGPKVIDGILATRHLAGEWEKAAQKDQLRPVAAIAPGVLGQTGIETSALLRNYHRCAGSAQFKEAGPDGTAFQHRYFSRLRRYEPPPGTKPSNVGCPGNLYGSAHGGRRRDSRV